MLCSFLAVFSVSLALVVQEPVRPPLKAGGSGGWLWIAPEEMRGLPVDDPSWARLLDDANASLDPKPSDPEDPCDARALAAGLVFARTREAQYRARVRTALRTIMQQVPPVGPDLGWARGLTGYVLAANLVGGLGADEAAFRAWLQAALVGLRTAHVEDAGELGAYAGASRLAICRYLGGPFAEVEAADCWMVFRRWCGDASSFFSYPPEAFGQGVWQAEPWPSWFGVNRADSTGVDCEGVARVLDGCMPAVQESLSPDACAPWPPPTGPRSYFTLEGLLAQAILFARFRHHFLDTSPWPVGGQALLRVGRWLADEAQVLPSDPANQGRAWWQAWVLNRAYGPGAMPETLGPDPGAGHAVGYADWTGASSSWLGTPGSE